MCISAYIVQHVVFYDMVLLCYGVIEPSEINQV